MTINEEKSPRIASCQWGRVSIDGHGTVKDAKLYLVERAPGWRETEPDMIGIQPADIIEIIEHGAETVVLSTGVLRMLRVSPETLAVLQERGIRVHVVPTGEAVTTYNLLRETERVGALIHSTC